MLRKRGCGRRNVLRLPVKNAGVPVFLDMYTSDAQELIPHSFNFSSGSTQETLSKTNINPPKIGHPSAPKDFENDPALPLLDYALTSTTANARQMTEGTTFLQFVEDTVESMQDGYAGQACAGIFQASSECTISSQKFEVTVSHQNLIFGPIDHSNVANFNFSKP